MRLVITIRDKQVTIRNGRKLIVKPVVTSRKTLKLWKLWWDLVSENP